MPWIEINELEFDLLCKMIQHAINDAGNQPAPQVLALCNLILNVQSSVLPDRDLAAAVNEVKATIQNQIESESDGSNVTDKCASNAAKNLVSGIELYGRKA